MSERHHTPPEENLPLLPFGPRLAWSTPTTQPKTSAGGDHQPPVQSGQTAAGNCHAQWEGRLEAKSDESLFGRAKEWVDRVVTWVAGAEAAGKMSPKLEIPHIGTAGTVATVVGGISTGVSQYNSSPATTTAGKWIDAGLAVGANEALTRKYPPVAVVDAVLTTGYLCAGIDSKGLTIADSVSTGAHVLVAYGEAAATLDMTSLANYQERAARGDYGPPAQVVAEMGQNTANYWAQYGVLGGLANVKYLF